MISKRNPGFTRALKVALCLCVLNCTVSTVVARGVSYGVGISNQSGDQYLVEFKGSRLPGDLPNRIAALGGTVIDVFPEINVALLGNLTQSGANNLKAQPDVTDVIVPLRGVVHKVRIAERSIGGGCGSGKFGPGSGS